MKSSVKRILTVLAAVAVIVPSAACGKAESAVSSAAPASSAADSSSAAEASSEAASSAAADSGAALDTSPVTMTMAVNKVFISDDGPWNTTVGKEITKQTGVTPDIIVVDIEKLKVLASGGDLPDLVYLNDFSMSDAVGLITSNQFIGLDDLLAKYGQNILKNETLALKWSKEVVGGGKTYLLPTAIGKADKNNPQGNGFVGFFSRYDLYKAVGSPKLNGEDDYLNALKKMQDYAQAKAPAGKKVYGLSSYTDWGLWPYFVAYPFSYGYTNLSENLLGNVETGEIESQFLDTDGIFWKGLKFLNKAYRMGVFDPEGLTQKNAQYNDKVNSGLVLTAFFGGDVKNAGDDAILTLLPGAFPVLPDIYNYDLDIGYGVSDARGISKNCKNPERAMQLLNYFDSDDGARLLMNGVKGTDWDIVDGKPQVIGERMKALQSGTSGDYDSKAGIGSLRYFFSGAVVPQDGAPTVLSSSKEFMIQNATTAQKSFAQDYDKGFSFPGQVYDLWVKNGIGKTLTSVPIAMQIMGSCSAETEQVEANAAQYMIANIAKIITAKDDAEFASVQASTLADLKAMGMEKANEEVKQMYEKAKQQADSFK